MKKALKQPYKVSLSNKKFTVFLMFIFVLFAFWGMDWFSYFAEMESLKSGGRTSLEDIYSWIAQNLSSNYIVFRFIVWGSSLYILLHMFKRLSIPTHLAIFFFSCIYIIWFSYARVSAAMVLVYYGLTILYKPYKNRFFSFLLSIVSIFSAFFFHKSALFGIAVALLSICLIKFNRKTIIFLLLCYPLLLFILQFFINGFMIADMASEDGELGSNMAVGQRYLDRDLSERGLGYLIETFLEKLPHFLLTFITFKFVDSPIYNKAPNDIKVFIRLQFIIVLLSSLFMFDFGVNTQVIFTRFIRFAVIPSCIILSYYYSICFQCKYTKITYKLAYLGTIYAVLYSMYNALMR